MRFVIIGEDRPARRVAEFLARDGRLAGWYTNQTNQPRVIETTREAGAVLYPVQALTDPQHELVSAEWLLTVNSTCIVPSRIIDAFDGQALNLHNGPLPSYAGRHVTQWGIRNGEDRFAATIHFLEPGIDTGDIVAESWFEISERDTGLSLFDRSFKAGADLMMSVIETIIGGGTLNRRPQDLTRRHLYRHKDALDDRIDWSWTARQIVDFVRAGNYAPLKSPSYTAALGHPSTSAQVLKATFVDLSTDSPAGTILSVTPADMTVACGDGAVRLSDIRVDGRKASPVELFDGASAQILSGRTKR